MGFALVAIDGAGGAGKSTLAAALARRLGGPDRTAIVHGDDFYRPMPESRRLLLSPPEGYAPGTVLVEGVYSARPELADYYDLTILVDTPRDVCLHRLRERGHDHGPGNWN